MTPQKRIVIFDLDGTLATIDHRRGLLDGTNAGWRAFYAACPNDTVNRPVAEVFDFYRDDPHFEVWIVSGRSDEVIEQTKGWLAFNGLEPDVLLMRHAKDHQPDHKLKQAWLTDGVIPKDRVAAVFDDRSSVVAMWRSNGLTCFQVAPGDF